MLQSQRVDLACHVVPEGVVPGNDGERAESQVPVLIMNGELDPQDPPENVAGADNELPNSLRIIVPGQEYGVIQIGCLYKIAQDFVESGTTRGPDTSCLGGMLLPPFELND